MNNVRLLKTYYMRPPPSSGDVADLKQIFPTADAVDLQALAKECENVADCRTREEDYQLILQECRRMCRLRDASREYVFHGRDEHYWPLPCHVRRTIGRAQSRFKRNSADECLSVTQVLCGLQRFQERLWQGGDPLVAFDNAIAEQRQVNTTFLFLLHVFATLSPRRVLSEWKLSREAFEWVLQMLLDAFQRVSIAAGEAVGAIAGQSIGEPATQVLFAFQLFHLLLLTLLRRR